MKYFIKLLTALILFIFSISGLALAQPDKKLSPLTQYQINTKKKAPKWQAYLKTLIQKHNGNKQKAKEELAALNHNFVTKRFVVNLSDGRVASVNIDQLLKNFQIADINIFKMGLEDMMELAGIEPSGTLVACMGGNGMGGGRHLTDMVGINMIGNTPTLSGLSNVSGGGIANSDTKGISNVYSALNSSQISISNNACRTAQINGLMGGLGMSSPGSSSYQNQVNQAKAKMNQGLSNCIDGEINPIASSSSNSSSQVNNQTESAPFAQSTDDMIYAANTGLNVVDGFGSVYQCVEPGLDLAKGQNLKALWGTASCVLEITGAMDVEELETAGHVADFANLGLAGATVAAATTTGGIGAALAGVVIATIPIGNFIADKVMDPIYQKWSDKEAKDIEQQHKDQQKPNQPGNGLNQGALAPGESDIKTCSDMQTAFQRFSSYCDDSEWKTYECMRFVAMMNECADPGTINPIINPNPESGSANQLYGCAGNKTETMKAVCQKLCEKRNMIAQPTDGYNSDCGCKGLFERGTLNSYMQKKICATSQGGGSGDDSNSPCNKLKFGGVGTGGGSTVAPSGIGQKPGKSKPVINTTISPSSVPIKKSIKPTR